MAKTMKPKVMPKVQPKKMPDMKKATGMGMAKDKGYTKKC